MSTNPQKFKAILYSHLSLTEFLLSLLKNMTETIMKAKLTEFLMR